MVVKGNDILLTNGHTIKTDKDHHGASNPMTRRAILHGRKMSYAQFNQLPEQPGLQLIDGTVVKEPSPTYNHQRCVGHLFRAISSFIDQNQLGEVILAPFDVILSENTVVQPDILFVKKTRLHHIRQKGLFGAPDVAVEILSPSTRPIDEGRKKELYLQHGCRELWIVDTDAKTITYHLSDGVHWRVTTLNRTATLKSHVIRGLQLPLSNLFGSRT